MPKDWKDVSDDELLNFDGPQTGQIAQYERIMRQRTVSALGQVWAGLFDVKKHCTSSARNSRHACSKQRRFNANLRLHKCAYST